MKSQSGPSRGSFEPDAVLPVQFFATLRRQAPLKRGECQLLMAVLEDAMHCYRKYSSARDREGRRLFRDAEEWLMVDGPAAEPDGESPSLSFPYVCEVLGLDPSYVRGALRRWHEQQSPPCTVPFGSGISLAQTAA